MFNRSLINVRRRTRYNGLSRHFGRRLLRLETLESRRLLAGNVLFRIDAGGAALPGTPTWSQDTTAAPSPYSNAAAGNTGTATTTQSIDMTNPSLPAGTPMALFQSERFDKAGLPNMEWNFPVAAGNYEVRLYFAESWSGAFATGARVFDVAIEGQTALNHYDVFADVGANKGVMKSFIVTSDSNLDVDFLRVVQNPSVKGIEILSVPAPSPLNASATSVNFGSVSVGQVATQPVTLTNGGQAGDASITIDSTAAALAPSGSPFSFSFAQSTPIVLAPGQSTTLNIQYAPTTATASSATLTIPHTGSNSPINISLSGQSVAAPLYRVDAGGPGAPGNPAWSADTTANPSPYSNASLGGNSAVFTTTATIDMSSPSIPAGTPMSIFQTERFDKPTGADLLWDFPVTPGQYQVRLYFAEIYNGAFAAGARVFDVAIEGAVVLDNYDVFADVGSLKGVVKTFTVSSDAHLNIDLLRVTQNPSIKAIEILPAQSAPATLTSSSSSLNFGSVTVGSSLSQQVTLTNSAAAGAASITINPANVSILPSGSPYTFTFSQSAPITLAPGQSTPVTITYSPASTDQTSATLSIPNDGAASPLQIALSGTGSTTVPISFGKSTLGNTVGLDRPTSLQFGPDGRLYVAQQDGLIRVYSINRTAANQYTVFAQESITLVQEIANHDDDGTLNTSVNARQVTGLLVTGTAQTPVIYVTSSDPRIGGGASATDTNLDTNSGILSRLTKNGNGWVKLDLVRGLPRSEENHSSNGLQLDPATNTLYIAQGGNTNMGATSNGFSFLPEFALSAAILKVDLNAIGNTTYDIPTLDDETRPGTADANDPFGGDDGLNQARLVPGGPVQVYAPGFRNPYDLVLTSSGRLYTVDNGPNAGWGDIPIGEGPNGTATNAVNEPGVSFGDSLHLITGQGYYGGHPDPTRTNLANTFNATNPQSPVPVADPIEGDYRIPGVENGALVVFGDSTNGIAEYTSGNFGGAMNGDLIIASFDNTIKRVKLNTDGTQVVLSENLFTNVGSKPLDVTTPATGTFTGTIWVADIATGQIIVFEPGSGGGGTPNDLDGDGYLNADEIANGTDPNNPGDIPPDFDHDFVSDRGDPDDDNDTLPDTSDKFAIDAANGANSPIGTLYNWENEGANNGGLFGMGFTGLMTDGISDYASLYNNNVTAGGAAGIFTIDRALPGTAHGAANTQQQAFQFGVNVAGATGPYVAKTKLIGPFAGRTPQAGQEMGFYIGTGDQDNYIQLVVSGDNGGSLKLGSEVAGSFSALASQNLSIGTFNDIELHLTIDSTTKTLQASYALDGGAFANLGAATSVPAAWISNVMAVGLIATDPTGSGTLPVTWDFLGVVSAIPVFGDPTSFLIIEGQLGDLQTASTFGTGSYRMKNLSTGNLQIQSITIDTRTSILPDLTFDPDGSAGNDVSKPFTPDLGAAEVGLTGHQYLLPHDGGGFDMLKVTFDDFDPGEEFDFSIDMEPTSIKGSVAPGPSHSGKISGLELNGATVTITYSDGQTIRSETFRTAGSGRASQTTNTNGLPPAPGLTATGITSPANVSSANQTLQITGPPGASVRLIQMEAGLYLAGVPNGGYDIDPFEANKAIKLAEKKVTIGPGGFVNVPVVLTKSEPEAGYNFFNAVIQDANGFTGDNSPNVELAFNTTPPALAAAGPGTSQPQPLPGDLNNDNVVDASDYVMWRKNQDTADYDSWRANFGETVAKATAAESFTSQTPDLVTQTTTTSVRSSAISTATQPDDELAARDPRSVLSTSLAIDWPQPNRIRNGNTAAAQPQTRPWRDEALLNWLSSHSPLATISSDQKAWRRFDNMDCEGRTWNTGAEAPRLNDIESVNPALADAVIELLQG